LYPGPYLDDHTVQVPVVMLYVIHICVYGYSVISIVRIYYISLKNLFQTPLT